MEIVLRLGEPATSDDYRALRAELLERDVVDVSLTQRPPDPGTLGPVVDALQVVFGSGAVLSPVAAAVVTWIRHRSTDIDVELTAADGRSVTVSAKRVRGLRSEDLLAEISRMRAGLEAPPTDEQPGDQPSGRD
ncbi:hypothetical protein [Dactylosporangium sp. NPDC000521]|uniref:effector-associated constant component EACC1 n=1 Tax=Dactylosporangium sp. NPDC000521 TaxID=3363975 RepID=UPI0036BB9494